MCIIEPSFAANGISKANVSTTLQEKKKYVLSRKAAEAVAQETVTPNIRIYLNRKRCVLIYDMNI